MAHWEVVVPIGNLGFCAGESMSSCGWVMSESGDATWWAVEMPAPNLGAGAPTSM